LITLSAEERASRELLICQTKTTSALKHTHFFSIWKWVIRISALLTFNTQPHTDHVTTSSTTQIRLCVLLCNTKINWFLYNCILFNYCNNIVVNGMVVHIL
jgi:hypothetical protein